MSDDNRLVNVFVVRNVLVEFVKRGSRAVAIEADGVPEDAQLRGGGYDVATNRFYLTFEHPSFRALRNGELIPELNPLYRLNEPGWDLITHLERQRAFSERTFGPGRRTEGVSDHIRKELAEIAENPDDLSEWVDVILLALDGAWRAGHSPRDIACAIEAKQARNERRSWPDWRTAPLNKAIEHSRE